MPRFALSEPSIGSTTSSGSASAPRRPTSSETICARRLAHAGEDRLLRRLVDRRRVVTAETLPYDGLALGARGQPLEHRVDVGDRRAAQLQPVSQAEAAASRR